MFPCCLQRMPASGSMAIYIEFSIWHWHFNPMLNASVMTMRAGIRVYIFHSHQFRAPVMSPFFGPHEPFDDVILDDIHPHFYSSRYPIMESLTLTPAWPRHIQWSPILWSHLTWLILWCSILWSSPILRWFNCLQILPPLLLLVLHHPSSCS